jgi:glutathione peroxidase
MNLQRIRHIFVALSFVTVGLFGSIVNAQTQPANGNCPDILKHEYRTLDKGAQANLCGSGKAVLVVNTASACGFTPQYDGLEKLHQKYAKQGLTIVGFPANDFGAQEKGSNEEIATFCKKNYGVSFAMSQKLETPISEHTLYSKLIKATGEAPKWNFHKYLITKDGKVLSFGTRVDPQSEQMTKAIELALR